MDEIKDIRDKAMALEHYCRQANDMESERKCIAIRIRAERRVGQLLKEMEQRGTREGRGGDRRSKSKSRATTLNDLGVSKDQSSQWQKLADVPEDKFESDGIETEQDDLFPALQSRYPVAHSSDTEPEYVLLDHLTEADAMFNVNRLRREGEAKLHHADALESWWYIPKAA